MGMQIDSDVLMKSLMALATAQNIPGGPNFGKKATYLGGLTESTLPGVSGCCGLFDPCGENALLSLTKPNETFLDWISWRPNNDCRQFVKMLSYIGPAGTAAGARTSNGAIAACAAAPGVEFGACEVMLPDKGRIARAGPVRDLTDNNRSVCSEYPVFTLEGQQITDELTWSLMLAGSTLLQDLKRMIVTGNPDNTGEFAGLETLVNTGYIDARTARRCTSMDSIVLDWAGALVTHAHSGVFVLIDYIIDIVRRIKERASWSNLGQIGSGQQILLMPALLRDVLLDAFTFWTIQSGIAYNEVNFSNYETRTFRNSLNGGGYGDGQIFVDGQAIPIITYDWDTLGQGANGFTGDIYLLTKSIGTTPVLWGQYIDMAAPAAAFAEKAGYALYRATDNGKFLSYWKTDETCTQTTMLMRPNIYCSAPWAQARIMSVAGRRPLAPMQPDPNSAYFVEGYLDIASCPEDYMIGSPA